MEEVSESLWTNALALVFRSEVAHQHHADHGKPDQENGYYEDHSQHPHSVSDHARHKLLHHLKQPQHTDQTESLHRTEVYSKNSDNFSAPWPRSVVSQLLAKGI